MSSEQIGDSPRWNIFARELEDILVARNSRLSLIDNRTQIHPEKVRRLQHSLRTPAHFPTLSPEDLDQIAEAFQLSVAETRRLRAAVLATAVEALLMDRVNPAVALRAADFVFTAVYEALSDGDGPLSGIRGGVGNTETAMSRDVETATEHADLDQATLALHLAEQSRSQRERVLRMRDALRLFSEVLSGAEHEGPAGTTEHRSALEEARQGQAYAKAALIDLGD